MSEQQSSGSQRPQNSGGNNNRRHHHNQRRRPQGGQGGGQAQGQGQGQRPPQAQQGQGQRPQGQGGGQQHRRRHGRPHHNRPRPQGGNAQHPPGINIERIYEKYLNLLDQHLIARRKYHDLFFRADPAQKNKLERNFYNSLHELREFENRLDPAARELFEKRNNGLKTDNIYTTVHDIPVTGENPPVESEIEDPHFLQSQQQANYADDREESVGTLDDYLKYKNLV